MWKVRLREALIYSERSRLGFKMHRFKAQIATNSSIDNDCMEKVRPGTGREAGLGHAGGTSPWMGEGRTMQEQLSRTMQEQLSRAMPGAIAEICNTEAGYFGCKIRVHE